MKIICVEKFDIHGGTVRVSIAPEESELNIEPSVSEFILREIKGNYGRIDKYLEWATKSHDIIQLFKNNILDLKNHGYRIWAFAASAKGNTLLNGAGFNNDTVEFIIDETPEKISQYSPGTGIMIKGIKSLIEHQPDYLIILSWNFSKDIIEKCKGLGYKGKFIIPIPEFKVIDS